MNFVLNMMNLAFKMAYFSLYMMQDAIASLPDVVMIHSVKAPDLGELHHLLCCNVILLCSIILFHYTSLKHVIVIVVPSSSLRHALALHCISIVASFFFFVSSRLFHYTSL